MAVPLELIARLPVDDLGLGETGVPVRKTTKPPSRIHCLCGGTRGGASHPHGSPVLPSMSHGGHPFSQEGGLGLGCVEQITALLLSR